MATYTASKSRSGDYTEPHACWNCRRAFWGKASWNRVNVRCPHCDSAN